jgi:hypothetical protein
MSPSSNMGAGYGLLRLAIPAKTKVLGIPTKRRRCESKRRDWPRVVPTGETRLNSRNLRFLGWFSRCSALAQCSSCARGLGCDYKRSAVSSLASLGGVTLLLKICVVATIFSSCFMILGMSAGFLKPSGSGASSAATVSRNP